MTDSENSQPQNDSDEDIYKDIPEFNLEDELAKLEGNKETYKQEVCDLSEKVKALTEENKDLKKSNEVLKRNLSSLLKTAQAEVQRKDSMIEELRSKVDSFTFRRSKKLTNDKITSTDDLIHSCEGKQDCNKRKSASERIRSKSYENRTVSDCEQRLKQEEEKKTGCQTGKEGNSNCDNEKKSHHRESTQNANFRNFESGRDGRNERHKERKSAKYEDSSGHRRPFRESHRDHSQYDTFDKKRLSRSSDNRFLSRRRSSRGRGRERRRSESCERRKKGHRRDESSERSRRRGSRKERSRSRGSKESSVDKPKSRSSVDSDPVAGRTKEGVGAKVEGTKGSAEGVESRQGVGDREKRKSEGEGGSERNKQKKERGGGKGEKRRGLEMFETKSPLDALYKDMVASRSSHRLSNFKPGAVHTESEPEEGELVKDNSFQKADEETEDWALSFKNERPNETKPMTLYSRRMMRKLSLETKEREKESKGKEEKRPRDKKETKNEGSSGEKTSEKEPGELTDDENIIESSKEFQELTKVAAIESEIMENPVSESFKDQKGKDSVEVDSATTETLSKDPQESEQVSHLREEQVACSEPSKADVIEFSPFKNNYKLIEISPIKASGNEHVLDFYAKRAPQTNPTEGSVPNPSEKEAEKPLDTSEEKDSLKTSLSENNSEPELKIVAPLLRESSKETGKAIEIKEKESEKKESIKREEKKPKTSKQETNRGKKKTASKKETLIPDERTRKRKRQVSEAEESKPEPKKPKPAQSEPPRKSTRSKRNSKTEPEGKQEAEAKPKEEEVKVKEDISSFEFFKPIAAPEPPTDIPKATCTATDFKMTATMSVTGVVRLETPNKCVGKLKNLMINEQMIFNVLEPKNHSQFSPLVGSKSVEMTPRRMLKNDLMLTDSEDDSMNKRNAGGEEEEGDMSGSESSDSDSDSGASDFVDLL